MSEIVATKSQENKPTDIDSSVFVATIDMWSDLHISRCDMDMRELKGMEIAARSRIVFKDGTWVVPSQSGNGAYGVILKPGEDLCSCDDFSLRQQTCKHIHAARLTRERDG